MGGAFKSIMKDMLKHFLATVIVTFLAYMTWCWLDIGFSWQGSFNHTYNLIAILAGWC